MRPHRRQPTRLSPPWNSPGKNTGVGCHFLLQCMKVKSESEVAQSCPTLSDPMDCSLPGSPIHGIFQARVLEWGAIAKITADGDCSHEIQRRLLLERKVMTNLDSIFGEGNGTPLLYSCLENPMDGGAWWAAVHGVTKSRTRLSDVTFPFTFMHWRRQWHPTPVLAWRIPGTGEPGGLPSMGLHRVGHD